MKKSLFILAALCCTMMSWAQVEESPLAVGDTIKVAHHDPDYTLFYKVTSTTEGSRKVTLVAEKEDYNAHNYTTPITGDVVVPATVTAQGNEYTVTELGGTAFYKQTGITSLTLPNTIVTVGDYALGALNLTEITLPNSVTTLQNQFIGNGQTTTIHIPASVTNITAEAFSNANALATITCDAENPNYTVVDNILYNKGVTEALLVPCNNNQKRVIEFPETVTKLGYKLFFSDHAFAQKIILPAGFNDLTGYFSTNKVDTVVFRCQDVPATNANTNFYYVNAVIVPCGKADAWMADENIANAISKGAYHPTIEEQFLYNVTMGAVENGSIAIVEVEGAGCNEVTIEATPAAGYELASWSVAGEQDGNRITLTVNADIEVTATFVSVPTALDNIRNQANISKRIVNGQLVIVREGKTYNMVGTKL